MAIPVGQDWPYDLLALHNGKFWRIQCKYVQSKNGVLAVPCRSCGGRKHETRYTANHIDCLAAYDATTGKIYYLPSDILGGGRSYVSLRLQPARNNQQSGVRLATEYEEFEKCLK